MIKSGLMILFCFLGGIKGFADQGCQSSLAISQTQEKAQAAFHYLLEEVELDPLLSHEKQEEKVAEFRSFLKTFSPDAAAHLTSLLLEESRLRVIEILQSALDLSESEKALAEYDRAILKIKDMDAEMAREILFFVAELKLHRQYIFDFGIALGCPESQLLRHDLCKLSSGQLEGYARYFRGGRREEDRVACNEAWALHQCEEHHIQCYSKPWFNFDQISEESLRNNMLEVVTDLLAATKQRGGCTLLDWLVDRFPKQNPDIRLLPYLEEALKKAHALYLESEGNPEKSLFKGLPCWNQEVEKVFYSMIQADRPRSAIQ